MEYLWMVLLFSSYSSGPMSSFGPAPSLAKGLAQKTNQIEAMKLCMYFCIQLTVFKWQGLNRNPISAPWINWEGQTLEWKPPPDHTQHRVGILDNRMPTCHHIGIYTLIMNSDLGCGTPKTQWIAVILLTRHVVPFWASLYKITTL